MVLDSILCAWESVSHPPHFSPVSGPSFFLPTFCVLPLYVRQRTTSTMEAVDAGSAAAIALGAVIFVALLSISIYAIVRYVGAVHVPSAPLFQRL